MRLIDPTKTRTIIERTEYGKNIKVVDHHNGIRDTTVKIKAIKISLAQGASPDRAHVEAITELEAATKEHRLAKASNEKDWMEYTTRRLRVANVRVREVQ